MKILLTMAIATSLCAVSAASAQNSSGLYKPARGGNANVQFGGQGGSAGGSAKASGTVKSRGVSKYYADRCLKPGPTVSCRANGDCVERPKPSVCSDETLKRQARRAEPEEERVSVWAATRERRAAENARRRTLESDDTGDNKAGQVRIGANSVAPPRPPQPAIDR